MALETLDLSNNELSTLPAEFGNLISLKFLDLQYNQLTGTIPEGLGRLVNLIHLCLSDNYLSGNIPVSFTNLINLEDYNSTAIFFLICAYGKIQEKFNSLIFSRIYRKIVFI